MSGGVVAAVLRRELLRAARNRGVHDLMRAQEVAVIQPLLDYLGQRNDVRLLGPREAARRAP